MTDQPPNDHTDQHPDEADQPPTTPAMVPMNEAAEILGISVNAVRQRVKRGTLHAVKTDAGWLVSPTTDRPPTNQGNRPPTDHATTVVGRDQPPTNQVDLSSLVEMVDDLRKENAQLVGVATWMLSQNAQLQRENEALRMIEAQLASQESPGSPESDGTGQTGVSTPARDTTQQGAVARLWRWLRGE